MDFIVPLCCVFFRIFRCENETAQLLPLRTGRPANFPVRRCGLPYNAHKHDGIQKCSKHARHVRPGDSQGTLGNLDT